MLANSSVPDDAETRKKLHEAFVLTDLYPDPLKLLTGEIVRTKEDWVQEAPAGAVATCASTICMDSLAEAGKGHSDGAVSRWNGAGRQGDAEGSATEVWGRAEGWVRLLIATPNKVQGKIPSFVAVNFCGNHSAIKHDQIAIPQQWIYEHCTGDKSNKASEADRGRQTDVWCLEQLIDRGYGLATFYGGDLDTDNNDMSDGVYSHF